MHSKSVPSWSMLAITLVLVGCGDEHPRITRPNPVAFPAANSPGDLMYWLEWSYDHRDILVHSGLFTDDFQFAFAPHDTAARRFPGSVLTRQHEIQFARAFFKLGTWLDPPPATIALSLDTESTILPDSRPGKDRRFHREVTVQSLLRIEIPDYEIRSTCRFFMVRGDSAAWPSGVRYSGPDSTHWFIELWREEPRGAPYAASRLPGSPPTWGRIKALYIE